MSSNSRNGRPLRFIEDDESKARSSKKSNRSKPSRKDIAEQDRLALQKLQQERTAKEKAIREQAEREQEQRARDAREKAAAERAAERAAKEKALKEQASLEQAKRDHAKQQKAYDKLMKENAAKEKKATDKAIKEQKKAEKTQNSHKDPASKKHTSEDKLYLERDTQADMNEKKEPSGKLYLEKAPDQSEKKEMPAGKIYLKMDPENDAASEKRKDLSDSDLKINYQTIEENPDEAERSGRTMKTGSKGANGKKKSGKRMKGWKKALIAVVSVLLVLVIAFAGTFLVLREIGRNGMFSSGKVELALPSSDESGKKVESEDKYGRIIKYNGKSYAFNNDIMTLTLIGVDNANHTYQGNHMADAIYILAIDAKSGKTTVIGVSRDTMGDVDLYSEDGKYVKTDTRQLCYSYDYYSDDVSRGDNTNTSLSRLFYGLPLKNYFAINMDAIPTLNDAIGGVTLKSAMTFTSPENGRSIQEGETVTLQGQEAEYYIQHRDLEQFGSNNNRMKRQQQYIRAFISSILPAVRKDLGVIGELYDAVSSASESTLDVPKLTYLASTALPSLKSVKDIEFVNVKGTLSKGKFTEYHVTNEDILNVLLQVFYKPLESE